MYRNRPRADTFIFAANPTDGSKAKRTLTQQRAFAFGDDVMSLFRASVQVITEADQLRGMVINPGQCIFTEAFWDSPKRNEILEQLRYIASVTVGVVHR